MKILFTDIDGVLNSAMSTSYNRKFGDVDSDITIHQRFDPMCSHIFAHILERIPDLKIVISSTWRGECSEKRKQYILDKFKEQEIELPLHED